MQQQRPDRVSDGVAASLTRQTDHLGAYSPWGRWGGGGGGIVIVSIGVSSAEDDAARTPRLSGSCP